MFQLDDIKTEYHLRSGIITKIDHFADFCCHTATCSQVPENLTPWEPFSSHIDFDFVELVLKANLTKVQTNELISLICRTAFEQFSVTDYNGVCTMWDAAFPHHAKFKKEVISVSHRDQDHTFDVWYRLLWDWACDLLKDHRLGLHFVFDAQCLYKYDGQDFMHFFDDLCTDNALWDSQSSLLKDEGKPFAFIIYADKVKLSSFSRQKAYPVIARCANLPVGIRNGEGFGGGRLVEEDRKYSGTQSFVNFKNVVWHESFKCFWVKCWDGIEHLFYPLILILSADYKEQCVMALIHRKNCKCPCPICLVPKDELGNVLTPYPFRTSTANSFSDIAHTDVHSTVSFDCLHINNEGNFSDHLWTQFQEHIKSVNQQALAKIDEHFDLMPHWRKLNHFNHVMDISFSDGSKYEDILKLPYLLLCCIHEYVNVNMYAALKVHTSKTIAAGHQAVREFTQLLDQYSEKDNLGKNWAYPKRHVHAHLFDDIEARGATRNMNTKPNEKCHGPIRQTYLWCMNFKNIAEQKNCLLSGREDNEDDLDGDPDDMFHVKLGAAQNEQTFEDLEQLHANDNAFKWFHIKLADFLSDSLPTHGIPLPNAKRIKFTSNETVTKHQFLKVNFESIIDWQITTDYLRCSPSFHNFARYDCVILQTQAGPMFGHLLMLFTCIVDGQTHPIALVHPYNAPVGQRSLKDKHLQFWHVCERPRISSEFFSVRSIIRGAALTEDHNVPGDYLVIDTIDTDMFLRMKLMHGSAGRLA
ncbi:uncharacterized protein F5891DRAFT_1124177 [Suillus fuscotomentosus]|uniref:Uncharacterized protein n=1 Tax=Suillus fuscotomentosus TaxID=1912939 RepID=A0AAD4ELE3_9AGAM|nr:uncharacterized protein F5891DRAFT_1124177 [Suillus fuscotomentosus]KAG1908350.1 hypothetical protein F5891DRAFT_1124177 [Suillus fuscotomentosus]